MGWARREGARHPQDITTGGKLSYQVIRGIDYALCKTYFRADVRNRDRLPDGPFILAPSHRSNLDSFLAALVTRRHLYFMAKDGIFRNKTVDRLIRYHGTFPVNREATDRTAMYDALEVLKGGNVLVVFPEGTRMYGPTIQNTHEGVAYLALRADVPIVPVGIGGSERAQRKGSKFVRPVKCSIEIGHPIYPPEVEGTRRTSRKAINALNEQLRDDLQRVFDIAQARAER
jgi:1-acyl-sn-glycerol-3-phosphate acyltransferase